MVQRSDAPVSILGLGPMGQAVAKAFLDAGHPTTVWNRTPARADQLVAAGAQRAATVQSAIAASPLVVVCLLDDGAVHQVLDPAAAALGGRTLVNLTSSTPRQARENAAWAVRLRAGYLDGAIMTPTPTIGQPSALVLYSGPEEVYQAHGPTLAAVGGTAQYLGDDPGRAAALDVCLLDIFWSSVNGIVHGLALARAEGIGGRQLAPYAEKIFGLLPEMTARFAQQVEDRHYPGERSTIASAAAGIEHILQTAGVHGIDTAGLAASRALSQRALDAGYGSDGLSRLVELLGQGSAPTPPPGDPVPAG